MNIALLTNQLNYTCGVTNHLLHLSRGLSEAEGNKVWIICGGGNGTDRFDGIDAEVIVNNDFLHDERNLLSYTSAITFLVNFVIKNKIDILHSHTHYAANIARSASRLSAACTVQTNHGLLETDGKLKHFNAKKYAAINRHIYDHILQQKIADEADVKFIRCGIPVPKEMPLKDIPRIKILSASRFTEEKGIDIYIKAVSMLDEETKKKADFYLAGDGEQKLNLLNLNKETGANISYLGNLKDMSSQFAACHILVYPSRSTSEGFPAVITEAGANGLLVITSNFRRVESVIKDNVDGLVFNVEDAAGLAKKLEAAINKYETYTPVIANFYNKISDWYSLDNMIEKHMELYQECRQ